MFGNFAPPPLLFLNMPRSISYNNPPLLPPHPQQELFFNHPWNNFLHHGVLAILEAIVLASDDDLTAEVSLRTHYFLITFLIYLLNRHSAMVSLRS